ncbi:sce7726 family protein [Acinetobacter junii]|uniref:sce7726 family protein n=1 Tax=Acinetobacter junii TaxID=40215 RepID=UPI0024477EF9|nr:sce7726 family protein [Acinetobacter junii]MDH0667635.1 sce7726 family protein [Acinetobacter junii]
MSTTEREIAKLFTSNSLRAIASGDVSPLEKIINNKNLRSNVNTISIDDIYSSAFEFLSRNYRNEYVYKNLIARKILRSKHSLQSSVLLSEFRVGQNKADLVLLNGCSTCYEIKTEYDSLNRLEDQLQSYIQLFEKVYVVCPSSLQVDVEAIIPHSVGIIVLTDNNTLRTIKDAISNNIFDISLMMKSLRKEEYLDIAENIYGLKIDVPNTQVFDLCFKILNKSDRAVVNNLFLKTLKKYRKNNIEAINTLPSPLTNALISFKFNKNDIKNLISFFSEKELNVLSNFKRKT